MNEHSLWESQRTHKKPTASDFKSVLKIEPLLFPHETGSRNQGQESITQNFRDGKTPGPTRHAGMPQRNGALSLPLIVSMFVKGVRELTEQILR